MNGRSGPGLRLPVLVALVAWALVTCGCVAEPVATLPPPVSALRISTAPARAMLDLQEQEAAARALPAALVEALPWLAFAHRTDAATMERQLLASSPALADPLASRAQLDRLAAAVTARREIVLARVDRFLPDPEPSDPTLRLAFVFGLPPARATVLASCDDGRVLLADVHALFRAAAGDERLVARRLERRLAAELFHLRFEAERWQQSRSGRDRLLFRLLNEGTARYLSSPTLDRHDEEGRLSPLAADRARRALARFEANVLELDDPQTAPERKDQLESTFGVHPDGPGWGVVAAAWMIAAVDRFGAPGRMRDVMTRGGPDLIDAYREVCGRHAVLVSLDAEVAEVLTR